MSGLPEEIGRTVDDEAAPANCSADMERQWRTPTQGSVGTPPSNPLNREYGSHGHMALIFVGAFAHSVFIGDTYA
jgi:hypothetical protein